MSHSVIALLPLEIVIKELIEKLIIYSEKLKFVSSYIVYEYNNGAIAVAISPMMTPTSNHIAVKYHGFRQNIGKEFVIQKINSKIRRHIFSPKVYKFNFLSGLGSSYAVGKPSYES